MPTITRFEEIRAWKTARSLTRQIYAVSNQGAFARDYGLRDQLRRSAVSIMSNIAEGFESDTQQQFVTYLGYAKASAGEVRAQLYVAMDVGYVSEATFQELFAQVETCSRQLSRFITYLRQHPERRRVRETGSVYEVA